MPSYAFIFKLLPVRRGGVTVRSRGSNDEICANVSVFQAVLEKEVNSVTCHHSKNNLPYDGSYLDKLDSKLDRFNCSGPIMKTVKQEPK